MDGEVLSEEVTSELDVEDEKGPAMQRVRWRASRCWVDGECMIPDIRMRQGCRARWCGWFIGILKQELLYCCV